MSGASGKDKPKLSLIKDRSQKGNGGAPSLAIRFNATKSDDDDDGGILMPTPTPSPQEENKKLLMPQTSIEKTSSFDNMVTVTAGLVSSSFRAITPVTSSTLAPPGTSGRMSSDEEEEDEEDGDDIDVFVSSSPSQKLPVKRMASSTSLPASISPEPIAKQDIRRKLTCPVTSAATPSTTSLGPKTTSNSSPERSPRLSPLRRFRKKKEETWIGPQRSTISMSTLLSKQDVDQAELAYDEETDEFFDPKEDKKTVQRKASVRNIQVNPASLSKEKSSQKLSVKRPYYPFSQISSSQMWTVLVFAIGSVLMPMPSFMSGLLLGFIIGGTVTALYYFIMRPHKPQIIPPLADLSTLPPLVVPEMRESFNEKGLFKVRK